jgi:uncharacterized protein (DUF433 family)
MTGAAISKLRLMDYRARITIDPAKRSGKPCIRGLRITVYDVLDYLAGGMSEAEILEDFPDLQRDDIRAALAFAGDRERRLVADSAA